MRRSPGGIIRRRLPAFRYKGMFNLYDAYVKGCGGLKYPSDGPSQAERAADEQGRSSLPPDTGAARGAAPTHHFAATFAQESLSPTVRLKTGLPGCESLASTQK